MLIPAGQKKFLAHGVATPLVQEYPGVQRVQLSDTLRSMNENLVPAAIGGWMVETMAVTLSIFLIRASVLSDPYSLSDTYMFNPCMEISVGYEKRALVPIPSSVPAVLHFPAKVDTSNVLRSIRLIVFAYQSTTNTYCDVSTCATGASNKASNPSVHPAFREVPMIPAIVVTFNEGIVILRTCLIQSLVYIQNVPSADMLYAPGYNVPPAPNIPSATPKVSVAAPSTVDVTNPGYVVARTKPKLCVEMKNLEPSAENWM